MDISQEQTDYICQHFHLMKDKHDLLALLDYAKLILFGENANKFDLRQINYYLNASSKSRSYCSFEIKKKTGGTRIIHAPNNGLKVIQGCIALIFGQIYKAGDFATGFVKGKSIVDNAKFHIQQHFVYNLDLKDFFPSIDQARIWGRLQHPPFNFNKVNGRLPLANIIAKLCCIELDVERTDTSGNLIMLKKHVLPQGAPTSPVMSNIVCERLDRRLSGVARRFGLNYSRYADDITFSSLHNVYHKEGKFINELERIINDQNFKINTKKTRIQGKGYRQEVTGLIVNKKINVIHSYVKDLRKWLYFWEHYGLQKATGIFRIQFQIDGSFIKAEPPDMERVIKGKLDYLAMVKGKHDPTYQKLMVRFTTLCPRKNYMTSILDIWESKGIEKAMEKYYEHTA
jgi:RNA-directed DNA polymerase